MNTVRCRRLVQTNELTCSISSISSARGKPGEVIAPMTCSVMLCEPTGPSLSCLWRRLRRGSEDPHHPTTTPSAQAAGATSCHSLIFNILWQSTYVSQELTTRKQHCSQSHQGRLDHEVPPPPTTSKLISDKYLLEAMAGQGSKGSPFSWNCHCFHENISFHVYCQTSVFSSKLQAKEHWNHVYTQCPVEGLILSRLFVQLINEGTNEWSLIS